MPSILENAPSDYLPADGFTHGEEASLKKLAKLVAKATGNDENEILQTLPPVQIYANNALLGCKYVSPVLENNLDGTCPIMLVSCLSTLRRCLKLKSLCPFLNKKKTSFLRSLLYVPTDCW